MRKSFCFLPIGLLLAAFVTPAWSQTPQPRQGSLNVGDMAPDFALQDVEGKQTVKLSALAGKPVVLIFGSCT
jgi:cytochrome oxidase Cu insertion factor (SCO1/SenC/PrrC family)